MYDVTPLVWILTGVWFFGLLFGDLILNRKNEEAISLRIAVIRTIIWIGLGVLFGLFIWILYGPKASGEYFTGYLIEKSLSIDNIFVWSAILVYLKIPRRYQYTVLFWGILGAIVFRTVFMIVGIAIIDSFSLMLLVLGGVLLYTSYNIYKSGGGDSFDPQKSRIIKFVRKYLPFTPEIHGKKLFVKINGKKVATYLLFAICVIELTDVLFAIDSVPTVLAVVRDPYIAITSNIAAILGLRALFFVFENLKNTFWLLNKGLGIILACIGLTLFLEPEEILGFNWFGIEIPIWVTLTSILVIIVTSIVLSLSIKPKKLKKV